MPAAAEGTGQTVTVGAGGDFRTIAAALADRRIGDGATEAERDHVVVLDGTYESERVTIGPGKRYVTIRAKNPGKVRIRVKRQLFRATKADHITIADLHCSGGSNFGWFFYCHHIVLDGVRYTGGQHGVRFSSPPNSPRGGGGHSHTVRNCWFVGNGKSPDGGHSGIGIGDTATTSWAQRILVEHCRLSNNGEDGIQPTAPTKHRIGMPTAAYIEIAHCEMKGNGENAVDLKACRYVRVHHNVMTGNGAPGIVVHSPENTGDTTGPHHCAVYSNLIADNGGHGYAQPDGDIQEGTRNLIFNNIVVRNRMGGIWTGSNRLNRGDRIFCNTVVGTTGRGTNGYRGGWGIDVGHDGDNRVTANIVFGNNNPGFRRGAKGVLAGNFTADPGFVSAKEDDYHLAPGSPALARRHSGRIFTAEEVKEYKSVLGEDLPINEFGPTTYQDDAPRTGALVPGALGPPRPKGPRPKEPKPDARKPAAAAPGAEADPASGKDRAGNSKAAQLYRAARQAERAGMGDLARLLYGRLVKEHPDSPLAEQAKDRLK